VIHEMTPEVFTADFVGEPGRRTFYLQARAEDRVLAFRVEKEQVALLGERLRELLLLVDADDTIVKALPARDPALRLAGPLEAEARIAGIGIGYLDDVDRILVAVEPAPEGDAEEDDETEYRFLLRRDQVRALVLHVLAVVAEGRPLCRLCGLPIDPDGHHCPASNGHRPGS
jgi:uncharacterized repeat protein (TIGR03847 family)